MKKVLLSLLLAIACMPVAFSQSKAGKVVTVDTTVCGSFTWAIDSVTYTTDTVVLHNMGDTTYVLNLTMRAPSVNTTDTASAEGNCSVKWNDSVWTVAGIYPYIITGGASNHCDSLYYVHVNLVGFDTLEIDTVSCGYYLSQWGDSMTVSTSFVDSTIATDNCQFLVSLDLTINPTYVDDLVEVTAGCSYKWNGITIAYGDTTVHTDTLKSVEQCDSVVSVRVTAFSNIDFDTVEVVACDEYLFNHDTLRVDTLVTTVDTTAVGCIRHNSINLVVVSSFLDTADVVVRNVVGGCNLEWMGHTYNYADVNKTFYAMGTTTLGECDSLMGIKITAFDSIQRDTNTLEYCGIYVWKGDSLRTSGLYYDTVSTSTCTTITLLDLTLVTNHDTVTATSCLSYTYTFASRRGVAGVNDRETFYETGVYNTSLTGDTLYSKHFATKCITYHTLDLTIRPLEERNRSFVVDTTVCKRYSFTFNGEAMAFTESTDTTLRAGMHSTRSCYDSIAEFHVIINKPTYSITTIAACDSYYWPFTGVTYTTSTTDSATLTDTVNRFGCDSIGKLSLTINKTPEVRIEGNWNLHPGETAHLTAVYNESDNPTFLWYKNEEPVQGYGERGESLDVSESENTDIRLQTTSDKGCIANNWITVTYNVGIDEVEGVNVNLYPNPASRYLNVESAEGINSIVIYNALGQQVLVREVNANAIQLDLGSLATGAYTMRLVSLNGDKAARKFVVNK
ncbi:MAG: T9SS type A sorting domain-containing protein [bacterium]